jgi:hypothetical protein
MYIEEQIVLIRLVNVHGKPISIKIGGFEANIRI